MKKFLMIFVTAVALAFGTAQNADAQAIGLRLGGGQYFGGEVSYLSGIGANRFEADLGFGGNHGYGYLSLTGAYHWNWNIVADLNWYVGPAARVGFAFGNKYAALNLGVGGQIGLEYDFTNLGAPIQLSLDSRPMFVATFTKGSWAGYGWDIALGVRYVF